MSLAKGFVQLGAGLSVGLAGLAAGFAIGIVGDAGVRGTAQQPRLFVGMVRSRDSTSFIPTTLTVFYRSLSSFLPKSWVFTVCLLRETSVNVADPPSGLIVALIMNTRSQIMTVRSFYYLMTYFLCPYSVNEHAVANSEANVRRSARGTSGSIPVSCLCKQCRRFLISSYLGALVDN